MIVWILLWMWPFHDETNKVHQDMLESRTESLHIGSHTNMTAIQTRGRYVSSFPSGATADLIQQSVLANLNRLKYITSPGDC